MHGGRVVRTGLQAGEVRGQPLDNVGHVGGRPGLSELQENPADGIL